MWHVPHVYMYTYLIAQCIAPSNTTTLFERTVHHLFIATSVVFSLALTQHNNYLCHYTRHMFMYNFSYVSPHVTVLMNNSLKSSSKRETRLPVDAEIATILEYCSAVWCSDADTHLKTTRQCSQWCQFCKCIIAYRQSLIVFV